MSTGVCIVREEWDGKRKIKIKRGVWKEKENDTGGYMQKQP